MPRHPLATLTAPCPLPAHRPGAQVGLLAPEQMQPLLPRLVPGLLAALRKEKEWERLPVTQALWAALSDGCQVSWLSIQQRSTRL